MATTFHADVVSAEGEIYTGDVEMLVAPAEYGEVGILPRHTPFISFIKPGEIRLKMEDEEDWEYVYVSGGMIEVQPYVTTVLADTAIRAKDLDEAAALEAKARAEEALVNKRADFDYARAQSELAEAVAQLRIIQKLRKSV